MKIGWFLTKLWGFISRKLQKSIKNYVFGAIPSMKVPFNFCPQKPPFLEHENVNTSETACPNLKSKPILKSSHKGFTLSYNWLLFEKPQISVIQSTLETPLEYNQDQMLLRNIHYNLFNHLGNYRNMQFQISSTRENR